MSLAGTIIVCDQVYIARDGRFVIAGTHLLKEIHCRDLRRISALIPPFTLYIRFKPERTGPHRGAVVVRDDLRNFEQPWMQMETTIMVDEGNIRMVEIAVPCPGFRVDVQTDGSQPRLRLANTVEMHIDGELTATTPLDLLFIADS